MKRRNQQRLMRHERRARERMAAKEAERATRNAEEMPLQAGSSVGFTEQYDRQFRQHTLLVLIPFLAVFVFYFPALSGEFIWDDVVFSDERAIRTWSGLWSIWFSPADLKNEGHYWPVVYTMFWLEHKLFGLNPLGHHIVNCILYFVNIILIWRLLLKLNVSGAWAISLVFAVHPLHVESVAWLIERKDLLSTLFYLGAVHVWLRFNETPKLKTYILALGFYVLGLLSKSIVVTLPAALLVLHWWKQDRVTVQNAMRLLPFFIVGFGISLGDYLFYTSREILDLGYSFPERILIAAQALWFYVSKLLWPVGLIVIYPHWDVSIGNPVNWLYVLAALSVGFLLWVYRHRIGKGPLAGLAFFVITLLPVLGFIDYGYMQFSFVADRFQYLAGLGLMAVLIGGTVHIMQSRGISHKPVIMGVFAALVIGLGTLTWRQASLYQDGVTFFSYIIANNPVARDAHHNLGSALFQVDRIKEGYKAALKAAELQPQRSGVHGNLGHALALMGKYDEAEERFNKALELDAQSVFAWQNYGNLQLQQKRYEDALTSFRKVTDLDERSIIAHLGLGHAYYELGHHKEALASIDQALAYSPAPDERNKLSKLLTRVLLALGRTEEAEQYLLKASEKGDSENELWRLLELHKVAVKQGDGNKADAYLQRVLKFAEGNPVTLQSVAETLRKRELYAKAIEIYEKTLAIEPDHAMAYAGMGDALFQTERYEEAIETFERSLELHSIPPTATARLVLMGEAAQKLGRPPDEAQYYERAVELDPENVTALERLAKARFDEKRYEEALSIFETVRELKYEDAHLHVNIGSVLYHLDRLEEALHSFEVALSLAPDRQDIKNKLDDLRSRLEERNKQT